MKRIVLAVALFVSLAAPAWAGFGEGLAAYQLGDYETALREFKPLAEQGNVFAQVFLGDMYSKGEGVPRDYAEAVKWYRRAAGQGVAAAQSNLGVLYSKGWGVTRNYVQAHLWFDLATAEGDYNARMYRDKIAEKMSPAQIAEAQRLARDWMPKKE